MRIFTLLHYFSSSKIRNKNQFSKSETYVCKDYAIKRNSKYPSYSLQTVLDLSLCYEYQTNHSAIFNNAAEYFYKLTVTNGVEEPFKVQVDYILVAVINYLCALLSRHDNLSQTKNIARGGELALINRSQQLVEACCTSRSTTVRIRQRRFSPLSLGISTLQT